MRYLWLWLMVTALAACTGGTNDGGDGGNDGGTDQPPGGNQGSGAFAAISSFASVPADVALAYVGPASWQDDPIRISRGTASYSSPSRIYRLAGQRNDSVIEFEILGPDPLTDAEYTVALGDVTYHGKEGALLFRVGVQSGVIVASVAQFNEWDGSQFIGAVDAPDLGMTSRLVSTKRPEWVWISVPLTCFGFMTDPTEKRNFLVIAGAYDLYSGDVFDETPWVCVDFVSPFTTP